MRRVAPKAVLGGVWFGLIAFIASSACSLAIDVDALENKECPSGRKLCDDSCVAVNDWRYGCGETGCSACRLAYATATCAGGKCQVSSCTAPHQDCDGDSANGCEADLQTDVNNCRTCRHKCSPLPNADAACGNGECTYQRCKSGFLDCDGNRANGCETPCDPANAVGECSEEGACTVQRCKTGFEDCDNDPSNGCEAKVGECP